MFIKSLHLPVESLIETASVLISYTPTALSNRREVNEKANSFQDSPQVMKTVDTPVILENLV